jgi:hypothetical protein
VTPTDLNKLILALAVVVSVVGAIDAWVGESLDLVVVFALGGALQLALLLRLQGRRPAVPIRSDLVAWLRDRAAAGGEPIGAVADRCVAACRADLDRS